MTLDPEQEQATPPAIGLSTEPEPEELDQQEHHQPEPAPLESNRRNARPPAQAPPTTSPERRQEPKRRHKTQPRPPRLIISPRSPAALESHQPRRRHQPTQQPRHTAARPSTPASTRPPAQRPPATRPTPDRPPSDPGAEPTIGPEAPFLLVFSAAAETRYEQARAFPQKFFQRSAEVAMNSRAVCHKNRRFFQFRAAAAMNTPALSRIVFPAALESRYERPRDFQKLTVAYPLVA